eukprot:m.215412 g.215412  ORF g.215412 m.215412 type:complete len:55 (-) comp15542_c0_seq1:1067-1231(-)
MSTSPSSGSLPQSAMAHEVHSHCHDFCTANKSRRIMRDEIAKIGSKVSSRVECC